jgi:hypothetical protein
VIPQIRPFTARPLQWNTYTALDVPLIDGGTAMLIPILALIGILTGLLWRVACRRQTLGVVAYALESVALLTAAGSFNFTAPALVGGFLISLLALRGASHTQGARAVITSRFGRAARAASAIDG